MKYLINILFITFISLLASSVTACSNGTQKENREETSDSNESEESASNQAYTVERAYQFWEEDSTICVDGNYPLVAARRVALVLRDSSGELVRFDNDADYLELIPTISFIMNSFRSNTCTKMLGIPISEDNRRWAKKNKHLFYETNTFVRDYDKAIISGVIDYLQGHKEKISDPVILEEIERAYYDKHPTEAGVYLDESSYNYKSYEVEGSLSITAKPQRSGSGIDILADGTEIPDGTLILYDMFW